VYSFTKQDHKQPKRTAVISGSCRERQELREVRTLKKRSGHTEKWSTGLPNSGHFALNCYNDVYFEHPFLMVLRLYNSFGNNDFKKVFKRR
jgi:hypothetical protein